MNTNNFATVKKIFIFTLFCIGVTMLSYCTSSGGRGASSFAKRKYTKGHFSDPVAKVKTQYKSYDAPKITANTPKSATEYQAGKPGINPSASVPEASGNISSNKSGKKADIYSQSSVTPDNSSTPVAGNNDASVTDNSEAKPWGDHNYGDMHRDDHHGGGPGGLLLGWILCLVGSLLCILIYVAIIAGSASASAGTAAIGTGCILFTLSGLLFIAAIVLFVLWIVALSRY